VGGVGEELEKWASPVLVGMKYDGGTHAAIVTGGKKPHEFEFERETPGRIRPKNDTGDEEEDTCFRRATVKSLLDSLKDAETNRAWVGKRRGTLNTRENGLILTTTPGKNKQNLATRQQQYGERKEKSLKRRW